GIEHPLHAGPQELHLKIGSGAATMLTLQNFPLELISENRLYSLRLMKLFAEPFARKWIEHVLHRNFPTLDVVYIADSFFCPFRSGRGAPTSHGSSVAGGSSTSAGNRRTGSTAAHHLSAKESPDKNWSGGMSG